MILDSVITCPHCGHQKKETMPTNACQWFYDCTNCGKLLSPKKGDCCVFCSYGTVACPPVQSGKCRFIAFNRQLDADTAKAIIDRQFVTNCR